MQVNQPRKDNEGRMGKRPRGGHLHRVALVCDFFYPRLGGVEMHIWSLAQCLWRLGHKVIIITHAYGDRKGVRYLMPGIKVYYCPFVPMTDQDCLPTFTASLPLLRWIFVREVIEIVHAHQATSVLAHESLAYGAALGLKTVYTDHSLFGFDDVASLVLNRVLEASLSTVGAAICVSHVCRENLILRAALDPTMVHAIPNAVDASKFTPNPSLGGNNNSGRIKVVVISRLVYRKGIDLLVGIIPIVCKTFDHVDFIVGGDGPKRLALEEQVERHQLQERVEFLGAVPHHEVAQVLARGQVFVNCSLTESFCIALLEAASCGLFVVSTNVGGVSEVLPSPEMMYLSEPTIESLALHVSRAIHRQEEIRSSGNKNEEALLLWDTHERIKKMYSWNSVAQRTARVYDAVMNAPSLGFLERLARYKSVGHGRGLAGYLTCLVAMMIHFCVLVLEWWQPRHLIDVVPDICLTSSSQQDDDDNTNDSVTMKHDDIISSLEGYSEIENKKRN